MNLPLSINSINGIIFISYFTPNGNQKHHICCMISKVVNPFSFTAFTSISALSSRCFTICME